MCQIIQWICHSSNVTILNISIVSIHTIILYTIIYNEYKYLVLV